MKAIMYHYVRPDVEAPPYYYYLDMEDFRRQLDHFSSEYNLIDRDTFTAVMRGERPPSDEDVVLTFDDGLLDHYEFVYPELVSRGLWGIFYVPTGPYVDGKLLDVHRIHLLLGRHGGDAVLESLLDVITEEMVPDRRVEEFQTYTYRRQEDAESTKRVKRILNYFVAYEYRDDILTQLEELFFDGGVAVQDVYLSVDNLQEMHDVGMWIGSHSITHRVFSKLGPAQQREEIAESFDFLEQTLSDPPPRTFCYPYGGFHTFTDETEQLLKRHDCLFAFNVESRDIVRSDIENRPLALPRYDCNEFVHGDISGHLG